MSEAALFNVALALGTGLGFWVAVILLVLVTDGFNRRPSLRPWGERRTRGLPRLDPSPTPHHITPREAALIRIGLEAARGPNTTYVDRKAQQQLHPLSLKAYQRARSRQPIPHVAPPVASPWGGLD